MLTTVPIGPVNDTRATARTLVPGVVLLGASEETLAPLACHCIEMITSRLVATDEADLVKNKSVYTLNKV